MCGRYTLFTPEQVIEIKNIVREAERRVAERNSRNARAHLATGEVRPTNLAPVLMPETGRFGSYPAFWGITGWRSRSKRDNLDGSPRWNKPNILFNTRDDTVAPPPSDKPARSNPWRDLLQESFHQRRCIIPASAFEEWQHTVKTKPGEAKKDKGIPYIFTMPQSPVIYIAGIWCDEVDEETGEKWPHFSMLTTRPSGSVAGVHDRMPVVLLPSELDEWMDGDYRKLLDRRHIRLDKSAA